MKMRKIEVLNMLARKGRMFKFEEALSATNLSRQQLKDLLYHLERQGWIERIEKGKYMILPLGAEKGRYTLHEFVIGSLLVQPYAISYWSALNYYGFTEQLPLAVFIQTPARKKIQNLDVFDINYKIVRIKEGKFFGITKIWIEDTPVNITDREKTIIDCIDKPKYCGGLIEVAKALKNGRFDVKKLSLYARKMRNSGVIRRLGYLCDIIGIKINLPAIKTRNYLYLDPTMPKKGYTNAKWRLIINVNLEEVE